eukprot:1708220-Pleurochrysis_carterae.AAC.1
MRLSGVVAPVHVVLREVANGDAGSALNVAVAREPVAMRAPDEVAEFVRVELRARPRPRVRDFRVV